MAGRCAATPRLITAKSPQEMESAVRERCLNLLAQQPRTRVELERSLARAGAPDDGCGRSSTGSTKVGLVDDTAYAEAYVRTGVGVRRRGTRSLRAELRVAASRPRSSICGGARSTRTTSGLRRWLWPGAGRPALARLAPEARRRRLMGCCCAAGSAASIVSERACARCSRTLRQDEAGEFPALRRTTRRERHLRRAEDVAERVTPREACVVRPILDDQGCES